MGYTLLDCPGRDVAPLAYYQLAPGQTVKLLFGGDVPEGMWVRITTTRGVGRYEGQLLNEPDELEGLAWGDRVTFEARHVIVTWAENEQR